MVSQKRLGPSGGSNFILQLGRLLQQQMWQGHGEQIVETLGMVGTNATVGVGAHVSCQHLDFIDFFCAGFYVKQKVVANASLVEKRGSRTQSWPYSLFIMFIEGENSELPHEVLGRPCVIPFWPVETPG